MRILFLFPYPSGTAASQRFRFEQYLDFLKENKIQIDKQSFIDEATWKILYQKGHHLQKAWGILKGFLRRFFVMFSIWRYDFIFVHREASPIFFPFFEWLIAKVFRKKLIFDFDDAIWLPNTSSNNAIVANIKFHNKTGLICKWAYKISAGNPYLCDFARKFNPNVVLNPTTIDTNFLHNPDLFFPKKNHQNVPIIGWTGTHSTAKYLDELAPILKDLESQYVFKFLVISNQKPDFDLKSLVYKAWNKETEIQDLSEMNLGVMPLTDDIWAKGKCGFKALQYMALGVPALVSPVGVNTEIVQDGINGFVCNTPTEWQKAIVSLLENVDLRKKLGLAARQRIVKNYSIDSNKKNFLDLFS